MQKLIRNTPRLQIFILTLLLSVNCSAISLQENVIKNIDDTIKSFVDNNCIAGLSVSIGYKNELVWSKGYGYSDMEAQTKVSPEKSLFRIASISKPITAFGLMQLVEAGKLSLDNPVTDYLTDFPKKKYPFSLRQLAGHLAGIRSYKDNEFLSNKQYKNIHHGLDIFKNDPLQSKPGSQFLYSSYGWNLISVVMDVVTESGYLNFMHNEVFKPLKMKNTLAESNADIILGRTGYYECINSKIVNAKTVNNSYKLAGGGFLSSSNDIARFGIAHLNGHHFKPKQLQQLWTPQKTSEGKSTKYGLGWIIPDKTMGWQQIYHNGGSTGVSSYVSLYPKKNLVISVLSNVSNVDFTTLKNPLEQLLLEQLD